MMNGFDVFKHYSALKAHFKSSKYNYHACNGQTRVTVASWNKRNDKYYFEKFGKIYKDDVPNMLISIFAQNPDIWVGDLNDTNHRHVYFEWCARLEKLKFNVDVDVGNIITYAELNNKNLKDLLDGTRRIPIIYSLYMQNKICPETVILFEHFFNVSKGLDITSDPLWTKGFKHLMRYKLLLKDVQWDNYKEIFKKLKTIK